LPATPCLHHVDTLPLPAARPLRRRPGLLFVFSVQSGIASLLVLGRPLLESRHAATAGALLALYAAQVGAVLAL
jgi:hypothetical protein